MTQFLCPFYRSNPTRHIGKSSQVKLTKGKYSQIKPPSILAHHPTHNLNLAADHGRRPAQTYSELFRPIQSCSDLIFDSPSGPVTPVSRPATTRFSALPLGVRCSGCPVSTLRALRGSVVNHTSLPLTPCSQTKAIVAYCRFSKIRPVLSPFNLNTRNAGLQTGKSPGIRNLNTQPRTVQTFQNLVNNSFQKFAVQPGASRCISVQRGATCGHLFSLRPQLPKTGCIMCAMKITKNENPNLKSCGDVSTWTFNVETLYHFAFFRVFRGPSLEFGASLELGDWSLELAIRASALFSAIQPCSALFSVKKKIFFSPVASVSSVGSVLNPS